MSEDARIFLLVGIIALIFGVIVPLLARQKKVPPTTDIPDAQEPKEPPQTTGKGSPRSGHKAA